MQAVDFTFPLRVECGFNPHGPNETALLAEFDGRAEITVDGKGAVGMMLYVEDAETGVYRPLSPVQEPDLDNRIRTFLLTDPVYRARLDEAEADERAAQWRERPRASRPAAIKEIA
jgi:hypothetical protein